MWNVINISVTCDTFIVATLINKYRCNKTKTEKSQTKSCSCHSSSLIRPRSDQTKPLFICRLYMCSRVCWILKLTQPASLQTLWITCRIIVFFLFSVRLNNLNKYHSQTNGLQFKKKKSVGCYVIFMQLLLNPSADGFVSKRTLGKR